MFANEFWLAGCLTLPSPPPLCIAVRCYFITPARLDLARTQFIMLNKVRCMIILLLFLEQQEKNIATLLLYRRSHLARQRGKNVIRHACCSWSFRQLQRERNNKSNVINWAYETDGAPRITCSIGKSLLSREQFVLSDYCWNWIIIQARLIVLFRINM